MFELTNEQRRCFALQPVLDTWKKVEVKASPYDDHVTYAFLDGQKIVKVIMVSDNGRRDMYREFGVDQMLSEDGTKILPKTDKGKPQNFTSSNLLKKTPVGMSVCFNSGYISVVNNTADQAFYCSAYNAEEPRTLNDFSKWVENWCRNTGKNELDEINEFAKLTKTHQKFKEGDFFRYRINRNLYGYGRILVDYGKMRKDGIPFWEIFMGKPLCVAVCHIATTDAHVTPEHLVTLKMLPSQMIMDNIFYYGECEVIGNIPISPDEDNYTVHYGRSIDARNPNQLNYQCGKTFISLDSERQTVQSEALHGYMNHAIGWDLNVTLPILLECIKKNSNDPYWNMISPYAAGRDLRNPKLKKELEAVRKQMNIK